MLFSNCTLLLGFFLPGIRLFPVLQRRLLRFVIRLRPLLFLLKLRLIDRLFGISRCLRAAFEFSMPLLLNVIRKRDLGFDVTGLVFQLPVAAEQLMPGQILAGSHIRCGQVAQRIDQLLAFGGFGQLATVQQQVAVFAERRLPLADVGRTLAQRGFVEKACSQLQLAVIAV